MNTLEQIILLIAVFFGVLAYVSHRKLKKRFDIIERMLAWKNILNSEETKRENLPKEVKEDIKEWSKGL